MDYEGNPLEDGGGGGSPTDITSLELKTQNILGTTIHGTTFIDGNVSISHIPYETVPIINLNGIESLGVKLFPLANTMLQDCIGQTFHITHVGGIDVTSFLIPVDAWYDQSISGRGAKIIGLFVNGKAPWLQMTNAFNVQDCTITADGLFFRYTLGPSWHLDNGVIYDMVCTCHHLDAVMQRPVVFVYDPIISVSDIATFRQVDNLPSNQWLSKVYPNEQQDLYFHIGFEFPRPLPDSSVVTVGDISLRSLGTQSVSQTFRALNQVFSFTMVPSDEQSYALVPHVPVCTSHAWYQIVSMYDPNPLVKVNLLSSPSLQMFTTIPGYGKFITSSCVYRSFEYPYIGDCVFEIDAEASFIPNRPMSVAITLTQMDEMYKEYDVQVYNKVTYAIESSLSVVNRWSFNGPITNTIQNGLVTKTRIDLSLRSLGDIGLDPTVIIGPQSPVRLRVSLISPLRSPA